MTNKEFGGRFEIIDESGNVLRSEHNRFYDSYWKTWFDSLKSISYRDYGSIPNIVTGFNSGGSNGRLLYHSPAVLVTAAGYARENSPEELSKPENTRYQAPAINVVTDYSNYYRPSNDASSQSKYCFIFHDENFIDILSRNNLSDYSATKPLKLPTIGIVRAEMESYSSYVGQTGIRRFNTADGSKLNGEYNYSSRYVTLAMYYGTDYSNRFILIAQTDFVQPIQATYRRRPEKKCHDNIKVRYTIEFAPSTPEEIKFSTMLRMPGDQSQLVVNDTTKEYSGDLNYMTIENKFGPNLLERYQRLNYVKGYTIEDFRDKSFLIKWKTNTGEITLNPQNGHNLYHDNNTNLQLFEIESSSAVLIDGIYRMHYVISSNIGEDPYFNIKLKLSIVVDNGDTITIPSFRVSWDTIK